MTPEKEVQDNTKLEEAIRVGDNILKNGGTTLDAVEKTIKVLEDSPLYNAGKGAVFTHEGTNKITLLSLYRPNKVIKYLFLVRILEFIF